MAPKCVSKPTSTAEGEMSKFARFPAEILARVESKNPPEGRQAMPPPETFVRGLAENHCLWVTALAVSRTWSDCLEEIGIC